VDGLDDIEIEEDNDDELDNIVLMDKTPEDVENDLLSGLAGYDEHSKQSKDNNADTDEDSDLEDEIDDIEF